MDQHRFSEVQSNKYKLCLLKIYSLNLLSAFYYTFYFQEMCEILNLFKIKILLYVII